MLNKEELLKLAKLYQIEVVEDVKGHKVKDSQGIKYVESTDIGELFISKSDEEFSWFSSKNELGFTSYDNTKMLSFTNMGNNEFFHGGEVA